MATRMQQRRGTAAQWISTNDSKGPILNAGEIGFESDSGKFKIGDGINHWVDLNYFLDESSLSGSLGDYVLLSTLGQPDGVATLGSDGKLDSGQLPDVALVTVHAVANSAARLALSVEPGDIAIQANTGATYVLTASPASTDGNWTMITVSDPFPTHDTDDLSEGTTNKYFTNQRALDATSAAYDAAGTASSAISTHNSDTTDVHGIADTSALATKTYADTAAANAAAAIVDSAPSTLNTLNELAAAINDDASYAATITTALGNKQDKVSGVSDTEIGYLDGVTSAVQTQLDGKAVYPSQSGNNGKYLTTNGSAVSWGTVDLSAKADLAGADFTGNISSTGNIEAKLGGSFKLTPTSWSSAYVISGNGFTDPDVTLTLPAKTGTMALTSDIPMSKGSGTLTVDTPVLIDSFSYGNHAVEYMIRMKQPSTANLRMRTSKFMVQTNMDSMNMVDSVDSAEYSILETGGTINGAVITAVLESGSLNIYAQVTDASGFNVDIAFSKVVL